MAVTYTQAKVTLDEIAQRSENARKKLEQAKLLINQADSELGAMGSSYSGFVSDLDAAATNNPDNEAWQTAKSEKDQMVTDFQALKTRAANLKTAVQE